jgi:hypothetical protein
LIGDAQLHADIDTFSSQFPALAFEKANLGFEKANLAFRKAKLAFFSRGLASCSYPDRSVKGRKAVLQRSYTHERRRHEYLSHERTYPLGLIAIGIGIAAAGIYIGETDDAPGAARIGILLMIGSVVLGVRTARRTA